MQGGGGRGVQQAGGEAACGGDDDSGDDDGGVDGDGAPTPPPEPPRRAKLGRPAQVVVPGGGLFALASTEVRAKIICISLALLHCTPARQMLYIGWRSHGPGLTRPRDD